LAADLALEDGLRALDSVHLASALTAGSDATLATWDERLWAAARRRGFELLPERL
jgi:predicted nucleic acid-binding protein